MPSILFPTPTPTPNDLATIYLISSAFKIDFQEKYEDRCRVVKIIFAWNVHIAFEKSYFLS